METSDPLQRLQIVQTPALRGWTVAQTCAFYAVSPATFYVWRDRFRREGLDGLAPRSRRPQASPAQVGGALEQEIVSMRRRHDDWGARTIRDRLRRAGFEPPAVSTIHQVLVRHDLVRPQPTGPRIPPRRFVRELPNDLWQIDATEWLTADDTEVQIIDVIDDHSRLLVASRAWRELSHQHAWATLSGAIDLYGPPRQLLSDNARWLTGRTFNAVIDFERNCWRHSIDTIYAAAYHPQTLGKLERQHRTVKHWLRRRPLASSLDQLQAQLDDYRHHYNHARLHQELDGRTPAEIYQASAKAQPVGPPPTVELRRPVSANGAIRYSGWDIQIGRRWAGATVTLIEHADKLRITFADELIATVILDRQQHPDRYISTGRPRGRPSKRPRT